MTTIYCPACGETSTIEEDITLQPGCTLNITCPVCLVKFDIRIDFYPVEEEDDNDTPDPGNNKSRIKG